MKKISIIKTDTDNNDRAFWKTKTPEERLSAVEFLREQCFIVQGYDHLPSIIKESYIKNKRAIGRHKDLADLELLGEEP
jgi:hypothetical protein